MEKKIGAVERTVMSVSISVNDKNLILVELSEKYTPRFLPGLYLFLFFSLIFTATII